MSLLSFAAGVGLRVSLSFSLCPCSIPESRWILSSILHDVLQDVLQQRSWPEEKSHTIEQLGTAPIQTEKKKGKNFDNRAKEKRGGWALAWYHTGLHVPVCAAKASGPVQKGNPWKRASSRYASACCRCELTGAKAASSVNWLLEPRRVFLSQGCRNMHPT